MMLKDFLCEKDRLKLEKELRQASKHLQKQAEMMIKLGPAIAVAIASRMLK